MPTVNIVIRTLNEGKWLDLCLRSIKNQSYKDFTVTVVDSGSTDLTLDICDKHGIEMEQIENYRPGEAINKGIAAEGDSKYAVILSAHCVPINDRWLSELVNFMDHNESVAGGYGGQVPMNFTSFDNLRDLAVTFRGKTSVRNDGFLHNANSIIRVDVWRKYKFDSEVAHVEDMLWASELIETKHNVAYIAEGKVTHHHGTNQHKDYKSFRSDGLSKTLKNKGLVSMCALEDLFGLSEIPIINVYRQKHLNLIDLSNEYLILEQIPGYLKSLSINELIRVINRQVFFEYPNAIAFCFYPSEMENHIKIVKRLKNIFYNNFPEAVIPVTMDHGNYWVEDEENLRAIQSNLMKGDFKKRIYKEKIFQGGIIQLNTLMDGKSYIESPMLERLINV